MLEENAQLVLQPQAFQQQHMLHYTMYAILSKSVENKDGIFIGFENYQSYFSNPSLVYSIYNSLFISIITMVITISLAFVFAYALTKSCMIGKSVFRSIAMIPILVPSLDDQYHEVMQL